MSTQQHQATITLRLDPWPVVHWGLVLLGALVAAHFALPVEDVGPRCPPGADDGHGACVLQKAYLPAVVLIVAGMCAGHAMSEVAARATGRRVVRRRRQCDGVRVTDLQVPRAPRFAAEVGVLLKTPAAPDGYRTTVINASATGLLLRPDTAIAVGDAIEVEIEVADRPVVARGRVVRTTRAGEHGVALEGLASIERGRLAAHLASLGVAPH